MNQTFDLQTILLAVGVIAVFGLFFGYVVYRFVSYGRRMSTMLDTRAERHRARVAYEEKHGMPPAWKQAGRRLIQILLVLAALGLAWFRLKSP